MTDYLCSCTAGCTVNAASSRSSAPAKPIPGLASLADDVDDPLLDLNASEEQELPFLTVATVGATDKVAVCLLETRMRLERLEEMLAVGVDGCKRVRDILDGIVRAHGKRMLEEG
jgi:exosome complex component RRP41